MTPGWEILNQLRISAMVNALQDVRETRRNLLWVDRIAGVDAEDGELFARYIGRTYIADLVADNARAAVYETGVFRPESYSAPNLKVGYKWTQENIAQLNSLIANNATVGRLDDFIAPNVVNALLGVNQRKEFLICCMLTNSMNYDRLGYKASGMDWGMPADLNIVPATPWTDATNGDAINDILTTLQIAAVRYGKVFNRVTMSTAALKTIFLQAKFQAQTLALLGPALTINANFRTSNFAQMRGLVERLLSIGGANSTGNQVGTSVTIETYDSRFWQKDAGGTDMSAPFMPLNKVILTDSADDNNRMVMDFANGTVVESQLLGIVPSVIGGFALPRGQRGPIGYADVPGLNPPELTLWAVGRGIPRKKDFAANACLTVGPIVDPVAVTSISI